MNSRYSVNIALSLHIIILYDNNIFLKSNIHTYTYSYSFTYYTLYYITIVLHVYPLDVITTFTCFFHFIVYFHINSIVSLFFIIVHQI